MSDPHPSAFSRLRGRFFVRLLFGMLAVTLPLTIALALVLVRSSSDALRDQASESFASAATVQSSTVTAWLNERRTDMDVFGVRLATLRGDRDGARELMEATNRGASYRGIALLDLAGRPLATTREGDTATSAVTASDWFREARTGTTVFSQPTRVGNSLQWYVARGVAGPDGTPDAVVVAHLDPAVLETFVRGAEIGRTGEAVLIGPGPSLLATSSLPEQADEAAMIRAGVGGEARSVANQRGLAGDRGSIEFDDRRGVASIGGFAPIPEIGWASVVKQSQDEAYASVHDQRTLAIGFVLVGILLSAGAAVLFARRSTRPLTELQSAAQRVTDGDLGSRVTPSGPDELRDLGASFNQMVDHLERLVGDVLDASAEVTTATAELSSGADELAAATAQQSSAATETSATMEELSRTAASIADNVEAVAGQAAETRVVLEQAGADVEASSARTLELARRVNDISGILDLINGIADKTSLLALNAAIEAARAGESGAGFTVVAEEVRRLADRSKQSAAQIAEIVAGTQEESNASVMAMEVGAKQMRRGLELVEAVAEAAGQARLTTEQQRAATIQVVETMESVSEASRQTSATSQQIAIAAGTLRELSVSLERTANSARGELEVQRAAIEPGRPVPPSGRSNGNGRRDRDDTRFVTRVRS